MPNPAPIRMLLLAVALLLLAACGSSADRSSTASTASGAVAAGDAEAGEAEAGVLEAPHAADATSAPPVAAFPVAVTDDGGEVTITEAPQRIVSLSASLTEILYAVGAGDQVTAVDRYSTHPAGAPVTDLSGFRPNVEAIAAHQPDLVLVSSDRDGIVDALDAAGIPVLLLTGAATLDDTYRAIEVVGAATGHGAEAERLVADVQAEMERLVELVPERDVPIRYYYELSGDLHSVTSASYIGELLRLVGLESIGDDAPDAAGGFPQLNAEFVLGADPAVIFLARTDGATPTPAEVAARPGWAELAAVRDGRIVALDPDLASRWGPRVVDLLAEVVAATSDLR